MRSPDLRRSGFRVKLASTALLLAFGALTIRAAHLTVIDSRGERRGASQTVSVLRVPGARGSIMDRHGAELAVTIEVPSVYAVPAQVENRDATARALAKALGRSHKSVADRLAKTSPFVYVARWISVEQARKIEALELAGIGLVEEPRRTYPQKSLAGHLIGFANIDGHGARAIEQMEDEWLAGEAQRVGVERDARRRLLPREGFDPRRSVGGDVRLTLDATLQMEVERGLVEITKMTGAKGGVVVVIDPSTGDVLALAEAPTFDPNRFRTTPYRQSASQAFLDAPEPGSTLKPVTIAAALEEGSIRPSELFDCEEGRFKVPGKVIRDVKPHGLLAVPDILRVSSNIGSAKIGFKLGARKQHEILRRFGFGSRSGSGFPDESAGLLRPWRKWRTVDHANVSFGQGMNVTVVQMASAIAALADGGVWRTPRLVDARREPGGVWQPAAPSESRRVVRADVADTVVGMMAGVVNKEGTGWRAALSDLPVAGKTGTAQKLDRASGTYSQTKYRAWFVGVAPAKNPTVALAVMLDEPRGEIHGGGSVAAPLFARAASAALARTGVVAHPLHDLPDLARIDLPAKRKPATVARKKAPARKPSPVQKAATPKRVLAKAATQVASRTPTRAPNTPKVSAPPPRRKGPSQVTKLGNRVLLPDFRGLSRGQVEAMTTDGALRIMFVGRGVAVEQFPAPGTIVAGSSAVSVRFAEGS